MKAEVRRQDIVRESICLIALIGFFIITHGCSEDEKEWYPPPPEVVRTVPKQGSVQARNAAVTFFLDTVLSKAEVKGATGETRLWGGAVTFYPSSAFPAGPVTLTLTGEDEYGQKLEPFTLSFTAVEARSSGTPPVIVDNKCKPENGAVEVDPLKYPEKLTIVFNERLDEAIVLIVFTDPVFPFSAELNEDGITLEVSFVDYTMPYDTEFTINLFVQDLAGNEYTLAYSFTTMIKE